MTNSSSQQNQPEGKAEQSGRFSFYKRYRVIIGVTYAVLLTLTGGFFAFDLNRSMNHEYGVIKDRLQAHILILDALTSGLADRLADLEAASENMILSNETKPTAFLSTFDRLRRELPMINRLTFIGGIGEHVTQPPANADPEFLKRTEELASKLKGIFSQHKIDHPIWLAKSDFPKANDPIMAVSVRASTDVPPAGVLLLELSSRYLNQVNSDLAYPLGQTMILDQAETPLSEGLEQFLPEYLDLAPRQVHSVNGQLLYWQALEEAPWTLIYLADKDSLILRLSAALAPQYSLLLVMLTLMMLVANHLTRHEFVDPATKLVSHIQQSGESHRNYISDIPPAWAPWFGTVTRLFRDNADLARVRQELQLARDMQASILPRDTISRNGMTVCGYMEPAKEIGGDFYDYFDIDEDHIGVVIADVSGKGVPAGLFMMVSRTLLKATLMAGVEPAACLKRVNDLLEEQNDMSAFVTVFLGIIDLKQRRMTYANGGHNPPYILKPDGSVSAIPSFGDLVLGMMPDMDYSQASVDFGDGHSLFLYTDGLTEAFNLEKEEFGEDRLMSALSSQKEACAEDIVRACVQAVKDFAANAEQSDDITCMTAHFKDKAE
ncbi:PP2C family protein-serine/threonine phosphatase [Aestuariispira insulae]|uniref:Stage II sporulation protein E n=1 Tax=Aestuariispira insulae TaxID=1461337 RepID=A0A3D9HUP6_9PROT|nr:PP2C family protein-serine/threonine phosphatase [Aestuariispira insulae]RED53233.1 stage II sporulation protein E [Aestuariispira insulae]